MKAIEEFCGQENGMQIRLCMKSRKTEERVAGYMSRKRGLSES